MGERKPVFKTVEEGQRIIEDRVGLLNRLIRQHPENPAIITWINIKEFLEKELLGYEIKWET